MRNAYRAFIILAVVGLGALLLASCGGLPVQLVMVVTATPDPNVIPITVTPSNAPASTASPMVVLITATPGDAPSAVTPDAAASPTVDPASVAATQTASVPTPTLNPFPTETRAEIYVAHQDFQNGYMFWISTTQPKVIWVLIKSADNPNQGEWRIYQDTFVDGEPEFDPNLNPPRGDLFQPRRGFGKLWRETPGLREALGWATTPEFALNTQYVYQPGGQLDASNAYVPGPGKHFITSLSRQVFVLIEAAQGFGRWEKVG